MILTQQIARSFSSRQMKEQVRVFYKSHITLGCEICCLPYENKAHIPCFSSSSFPTGSV